MKKTAFLLFGLLVLVCIKSYSQASGYDYTAHAFNYDLTFTPTGQVQNTYDTVYTVNCEIEFMDITGIKKIHIKAKKQDTGLDMINEIIDMQNTTSASVPVQVNQNTVIISFGDIINKGLELDLKMQDLNDNESHSIIKNY